jgi:hypothetical protein
MMKTICVAGAVGVATVLSVAWMSNRGAARIDELNLVEARLRRAEYELEKYDGERSKDATPRAAMDAASGIASPVQNVPMASAASGEDLEVGARVDELLMRIQKLELALEESANGIAGAQTIEVAESVARDAVERYGDLFLKGDRPGRIRGQALEMLQRFPARFDVWDQRTVDEMLRIARAPATDRSSVILCGKIVSVVAAEVFSGGEIVLMEVINNDWEFRQKRRSLRTLDRYHTRPGVSLFVRNLAQQTVDPKLADEARAWLKRRE